MRILIDMQGAQGGNRQRGIGKYSLNLAVNLAHLCREHELYIVLNGSLPESIGHIRDRFKGILDANRILVWACPTITSPNGTPIEARRQQAELLREAFLASFGPDWIVVLSHFEGQHDNVVSEINAWRSTRTAVVLYDLIPWIHSGHYLANELDRKWYYSKIDGLKRANLLLAISAATRSEAIKYLGFEEQKVVNISAAAEEQFKPIDVTAADMDKLKNTYSIHRPFVMYTGGIDYRKNIEGLIRAYSALSLQIRKHHQLVIVCYMNDIWHAQLKQVINELDLDDDEVVMTGYVPDDDLLVLYNACTLFVFPSWHEGFGLPLLEAMQCGKPVIAAKLTSLPEVVGRNDALFDPFDQESITAKLNQALTNHEFRRLLAEHGLQQCKKFSWKATAESVLTAIEKNSTTINEIRPVVRKRLAFISPLPPDRSGISDYSISLLMELTRWYRIDVVVVNPEAITDIYVHATCGVRSIEEFLARPDKYDRVLYHFGNSEFHKHMFELLSAVPGVVVLHDFYLSAIQMWSELTNLRFAAMTRARFAESGYKGVIERFGLTGERFDHDAYPASLPVIQDALGVIVHSQFSRNLAIKWYGKSADDKFSVVPFLNRLDVGRDTSKASARRALGLPPDALVVCSFGYVTEQKLVHRLIEAWKVSNLNGKSNAFCVLVGEAPGEYGIKITQLSAKQGTVSPIILTGWVDGPTYNNWIAAADIAVQLRKDSRGETSASVFDCIGRGIPTIVNAHGFAAELDPGTVWMLADEFDNEELVEALEILAEEPGRREQIGEYGRQWVRTTRNSRICAEAYFDAIETTYLRSNRSAFGIAKMYYRENGYLPDDFVSTLSANFPLQPRVPMLLVDISEIVSGKVAENDFQSRIALLKNIIRNPPCNFNVEPIYALDDSSAYRYARQFTLSMLKCPLGVAYDENVQICSADVILSLNFDKSAQPIREGFYHQANVVGALNLTSIYKIHDGPIIATDDSDKKKAVEQLTSHGLSPVAAFEFLYCLEAATKDVETLPH